MFENNKFIIKYLILSFGNLFTELEWIIVCYNNISDQMEIKNHV